MQSAVLDTSRSEPRRHHLARLAFSVMLLFLACANSVSAQSSASDASIDGYVVDSTGAAIANAQVSVKNSATNVEEHTQTDSHGYYLFPIIKIGTYAVTVGASNFTAYQQSGIKLVLGSQEHINATLKLGSASSVVEVQSDATILNASTPAIGATIPAFSLRELPIVARNMYDLYFFSPGIKGNPTTTFSSPYYGFGGLTSSVWQLDGLDNTQRDGEAPTRLVISSPEVLDQTQVIANGYSAEFGRTAGGIINASTRGGTNEFHGQLMTIVRPNAFSAIPNLATVKPSARNVVYQGNVGGPIIHNRVFFFGNFELNEQNSPSPVTVTAANAATLGLPSSELGSAAVTQTLPAPSVRVDWKINERNNAFFRWTHISNEEPDNTAGGLTPANTGLYFHDHQQGGEAQLATVLSPRTLNELRFGIVRRDQFRTPMQTPNPNDVLITITGVANIGNSPGVGYGTTEQSTQLVENLTKTVGRHTMKFGADVQYTDNHVSQAISATYTFSSLANYETTLAGTKQAYQQLSYSTGTPSIDNHFYFYNAYAQDEFRISPKLTVNYGLRYQFIQWPELDQNAPYTLSRSINESHADFAPRFSISYGINPKTVIRAAGGLYFDTPNLTVFDYISQRNGDYIQSYTVTPTTANAPKFPNVPASGFSPVLSNITVYDPNYRDMYAIQSNLQVERELLKDLSINLQYSMSLTRRGPYAHDINLGAPTGTLADGRPVYGGTRPNTQFAQIVEISSGSNTNYHGLDVTLNKRLSHGLQIGTTYSYSHALGTFDESNTSKTIYTNPIDNPTSLQSEYGPLSSDIRNNWVFYGVYRPTGGEGAMRFVNGLTLSVMSYVHSGLPINEYAGSDLNKDGQLNDRPLFTSRNSFSGPNFFQQDVRAGYYVPLLRSMERYRLEFFVESGDILNHPNLNCGVNTGCTNALTTTVTSASFLKPTSMRDPRVVQIGGRLQF